jgi:hypothetical protein
MSQRSGIQVRREQLLALGVGHFSFRSIAFGEWSLVWGYPGASGALSCFFGSESVILCIHIPRQGSVHTSFRTYLFSRFSFYNQLVDDDYCGIGILSASYEIYEHCEHSPQNNHYTSPP